MGYYGTSSEYEACYPALWTAAEDMGMSAEQINMIKYALEDKGLVAEKYDERQTQNIIKVKLLDVPNAMSVIYNIDIQNVSNIYEVYGKEKWENEFQFVAISGKYRVTITAEGYKPVTQWIKLGKTPETYTIWLIPNEFEEDPHVADENYIEGRVIDVTTGMPVQGAIVNIRTNLNCQSGRYWNENQCVTDVYGIYRFDNVPFGYYTVESRKEGYVNSYQSVYSIPEDYRGMVDYESYIFPLSDSERYRIVLTWGAEPSDLDSHLECSTNGILQYHIAYWDKIYYENNLVAQLDLDDTSAYGPETVTVTIDKNKDYRYYVNWFAGGGSWYFSNATVKVYKGNVKIRTFYVQDIVSNKEQYDGIWDVFRIEDGKLIETNIIR